MGALFTLVHRYRRPFVLLNGLAIVAFGLGAAVVGGPFWAFFGVSPGESPLLRLLGWYLAVHGVGAVLVARAPERQPVVVAMVGLEKIGAVVCFAVLAHAGPAWIRLALLAGFDAAMAAVFLGYFAWLGRSRPESGMLI